LPLSSIYAMCSFAFATLLLVAVCREAGSFRVARTTTSALANRVLLHRISFTPGGANFIHVEETLATMIAVWPRVATSAIDRAVPIVLKNRTGEGAYEVSTGKRACVKDRGILGGG
jgi:hypothetical protein